MMLQGGTPGGRASMIGAGSGTAHSIKRIMKECEEIIGSKNPYWTACPLDMEDPFEWHFTVRGPVDTEFQGGIYHGRIVLPQNYPLGPPSVMLLTQNGRFEIDKKVCLSASNYHPELWQPAWGLRTMLDALHAFFTTPADGAVHSLNWDKEVRRRLAAESSIWICPICLKSNSEIVDKYCETTTNEMPALPSPLFESLTTVNPSIPSVKFRSLPSNSNVSPVNLSPDISPKSQAAILYHPNNPTEVLSSHLTSSSSSSSSFPLLDLPPSVHSSQSSSVSAAGPQDEPVDVEDVNREGCIPVVEQITEKRRPRELTLQERKARREAGTELSRQKEMPFTFLFVHVFIVRPISHTLRPLFTESSSFMTKIACWLDVVCGLLLLYTGYLLVDLYRRPGVLIESLISLSSLNS